ncbi:MAG TPA: nitroreductase/quinone reductase family protein [Candidatus Limnocylindrales bacterium]
MTADDLVRAGRVARLDLPADASGKERSVAVGFAERPDGALLVAAGSAEAVWARALEAEPQVGVTIGDRSFRASTALLADDDPRRAIAIRELILRYGTPSERLGRGPVFVLTPLGSSPSE